MTQTQHSSENADKTESPAQSMRRMAGGFMMTQVLHLAAQLGIADELRDEARSVAYLADALHLDEHVLERVLRMMVVLDLLAQEGISVFKLTSIGQLLRSDHPHSMRDRILYIGAISYPVASAALHSARTGEPAFDHVFGKPFFVYLAEQPTLGRLFNSLMQHAVHCRIPGILQAFDFSQARHIVDIGGGTGDLMSAILAQTPASAGTIFDTVGVIAEARSRLADTDVGHRIELVEGDIFRGSYPQGADLYLLSNIIHDWSDPQSQTILRHCVSAMSHSSSLMLIEEVMPEKVSDSPATTTSDYSMLLLLGGKERTEAQYRALLDRSDLMLSSIIPFAAESHNGRHKGNWALLVCRTKQAIASSGPS